MTNGENPRVDKGESDGSDDAAEHHEGDLSAPEPAPDIPEPAVEAPAPAVEASGPPPEALAPAPAPTLAPVAPIPPVAPVPPPGAASPAPPVPPSTSGAPPVPGSVPRPPPKPTGRVVEGVVTSVTPQEVELTLDDGRPAVISRNNFGPNNEDPTSVLSVGDRAFGSELLREDPKNRVVLSRAWALKKKAWDKILDVVKTKATISGRVVSAGAKGLVVDVGVRGFVPSSHLELETPTDLSPYVDQVLEFRVLEAEPRRERLVLSRRSQLLKEQRKKSQELLGSLKRGDSCRGRVTSITDYGAFVDIGGGMNGLVHLSELSWHRVRKPNDVVALGDEVEVRILDVKIKKRRISLSMRQMQPDPLSQLEVGEIRQGPVTRLVDFGAFVSLGDVEGLVHLSELAEYRVSTPEEVVAPGDEVGVKILSIDKKRRRVELSIRRAAEFGG